MKETRSEEAFVDFPTKKKIQFTLDEIHSIIISKTQPP